MKDNLDHELVDTSMTDEVSQIYSDHTQMEQVEHEQEVINQQDEEEKQQRPREEETLPSNKWKTGQKLTSA